jgi:4-amino-4-deoxy-L-arabinose transferase-like glycosyltransferase
LIFATGTRLFQDDKTALLAAAIAAFSPLMLGVSRIWYPDHYAVIFSALALYAATRIATTQKPDLHHYILLGIAVGLSISAKYNGLFFAALIPIAHASVVLRIQDKNLRVKKFFFSAGPWLAGLAIVAAFLATNPYFFRDFSKYIEAIQLTRAVYLAGSPGLRVENTPVFYSTILLFTTFGIMGAFFIIAGAAQTMRHNIRAGALLILMPIIFIGMMSEYKNAFDRNLSVLIPYVALLFAAGFAFLWKYKSWHLITAILVIVSAEPAARIMLNTYHDFQPDSRQLAAAWMDQNIPAHSEIGLGRGVYNKSLGIPLNDKKFQLVELSFPPELTTLQKTCINYYYIDQWLYQIYGKGTSIFTSPYYSENIFRNTGGYYFKTEHENIVKWLAEFKEIHRIKGNHYGPDVYIYKRKTPC